MQEELELKCEEDLARVHKYLLQAFDKNIEDGIKRNLPFSMIRAKEMYKIDKDSYDKVYRFCKKFNVNVVNYMKWCLFVNCTRDINVIVQSVTFINYANFLKRKKQYKNIFDYYNRSARNVAELCIKNNWSSSLQYLRNSIVNNTIGSDYISGFVSKYFLVTIPGFRKIFTKIDRQTRDELSIIINVCDELNKDVQDVFLEFTGKPVQAMEFTDNLINKLKNKTN